MRHAFLVIAHHQFEILANTLRIMNDYNVDFFIHIDKKCTEHPEKKLMDMCTKSKVYFIDRIPVYWGGYSSIECTLNLLEAAVPGGYDYYHLISGVDLPIKKKKDILNFFSLQPQKQYIHFEKDIIQDKYVDRLRYYSFFQDTGSYTLQFVDRGLRYLEKLLRVDRTRHNNVEWQYGSNWFSITHELAEYVLSKKNWIQNTFSKTRCGDELLIQTIAINSPFRDQLTDIAFDDNYMSNIRFIDWKRGKPYVFRIDNYEELINSPYMFARKFDIKVDPEIISKVFQYCVDES